ncbi:MAG: hypothetical protein C5B60_10250 [Chloroflexi bacterium]|nr:MAG: hypothetical protein C5B60_10250 [Chloroflexota bacterium]
MLKHFLIGAALSFPVAAAAQSIEFGPHGIEIEPFHHGRQHDHPGWGEHHGWGPSCERLRRACEYKEELGEEGMGNCRRYRRMCWGD